MIRRLVVVRWRYAHSSPHLFIFWKGKPIGDGSGFENRRASDSRLAGSTPVPSAGPRCAVTRCERNAQASLSPKFGWPGTLRVALGEGEAGRLVEPSTQYGVIAQLGERRYGIPKVRGSSPRSSTLGLGVTPSK
jgi:hypothetical protein